MCNGKSVIQRVCRLCITIHADQECDGEIQMSAKACEFEWQRWRFWNNVVRIWNHLLSPTMGHQQSKRIFPNTKGYFIIEHFRCVFVTCEGVEFGCICLFHCRDLLGAFGSCINNTKSWAASLLSWGSWQGLSLPFPSSTPLSFPCLFLSLPLRLFLTHSHTHTCTHTDMEVF